MIQRHTDILQSLREQGHCSVEDFCAKFKVSEMTVRRDLQSLETSGRVLRTHGGAVLAERVAFEFGFMQRAMTNWIAKRHIAAAAIALLGDAKTIMMDSGTTTLALAELLRPRQGLTVITTSLPIASTLQFSAGVDVLLLGGFLRSESPDLSGALTEANLETLHADIAFIGADAVDARGAVYNRSLPVSRMLKKMTAAADRFYMVADSSKLEKKALARFANLQEAAGLITDSGVSTSARRALKAARVKVIVAGGKTKSRTAPGK